MKLKSKQIFLIGCYEDKEVIKHPVEGQLLLYTQFDCFFFIHSPHSIAALRAEWTISEFQSGSKVVYGGTKMEAFSNLKKLLARVGEKRFKEERDKMIAKIGIINTLP